MPKDRRDLWDALIVFDTDSRAALFAHCASLTVNAVHEPWNRSPGPIMHAGQLARAVGLDMVAAGWAPTVENYLGRSPRRGFSKRCARRGGEASAQLIGHLKKPDMAREAERLLAGSGWLPEPLRMPALEPEAERASGPEAETLPDFLATDDGSETHAFEPHAMVAE